MTSSLLAIPAHLKIVTFSGNLYRGTFRSEVWPKIEGAKFLLKDEKSALYYAKTHKGTNRKVMHLFGDNLRLLKMDVDSIEYLNRIAVEKFGQPEPFISRSPGTVCEQIGFVINKCDDKELKHEWKRLFDGLLWRDVSDSWQTMNEYLNENGNRFSRELGDDIRDIFGRIADYTPARAIQTMFVIEDNKIYRFSSLKVDLLFANWFANTFDIDGFISDEFDTQDGGKHHSELMVTSRSANKIRLVSETLL